MKLYYKIIIGFALISSFSNAQQWNGSPNSTGVIYRDGKVGIGILSPNGELHIGKKTGADGSLIRLSLEPPKHTGGPWNFITRDNGSYAYLDQYYGSKHLLTYRHDGRVGIGVLSPNSELHIGKKTGADGSLIRFSLEPPKHTGGPWNFITRDNGSYAYLDQYYGSKHILTYRHDGGVGIGTNNPGVYKLAVNGTIRAKEIVIETGWADFVFESDYHLPTLEEVENHIKEKGHLKDIPSAKEVAEKGIGLGEMDAKLLQKIEELTLYTIEQEKEIDQLKKINQGLEAISSKLLELQTKIEELESTK